MVLGDIALGIVRAVQARSMGETVLRGRSSFSDDGDGGKDASIVYTIHPARIVEGTDARSNETAFSADIFVGSDVHNQEWCVTLPYDVDIVPGDILVLWATIATNTNGSYRSHTGGKVLEITSIESEPNRTATMILGKIRS